MWFLLLSVAHALTVEASIDGGPWHATTAVAVRSDQSLALRVPGEGEVRWHAIVPDLSRTYKNAQEPWDPQPYAWIGFAEIGYERSELVSLRGQSRVEPLNALAAHQAQATPAAYVHGELGSYWLQAELHGEDGVQLTAGVEQRTPSTVSRTRSCASACAPTTATWAGSPATCTCRGCSARCRDSRGTTWVSTVPTCSSRRAGDGAASATARTTTSRCWSTAARTGRGSRWSRANRTPDCPGARRCSPAIGLAVRYEGARQYQHIGALYADDGDGVLGPGDTVLHAGPEPLHLSRLSEGGFDGHVVVIRPE